MRQKRPLPCHRSEFVPAEIVRGLEGASGKPVPTEDIARVSVIPSGTFHCDRAASPNG